MKTIYNFKKNNMKNIWLLPTDKPSRLVLNSINNDLFLTTNVPNWFETNLKTTKQNIYITDDSEIKEGDYYIHGNRLHKHFGKKCLDVLTSKKYPQSSFINKDLVFKKIILTTDKDLIKDGVQAIDDEFLEWFVKNPSCEWVEIGHEKVLWEDGRITHYTYIVIIPKEEIKQDLFCPKCDSYVSSECVTFEETHQICNTGVVIKEQETLEKYSERFNNKDNEVVDGIFNPENWGRRVVKQETLEEVAKNYAIDNSLIGYELMPYKGFIEGAKWQQERSYNELFEWLASKDYLSDKVDVIQKEFKQFKSK